MRRIDWVFGVLLVVAVLLLIYISIKVSTL